ncbi:MAG: hypothetical protein ABIH23_28295 [bacterium]
MRSFRFRLASFQRIKRYKIEEVEREIANLEGEVEDRLTLIDEGRKKVAEFQRFLIEEIPDIHSVELEVTESAFRGYMLSEETRRYREIGEIRKQQEEKRKELVKLYQEDKMLERLKDRQWAAWQKEASREEVYLLDEVGGQSYFRQHKPAGGAMLVILGLVALVGAAGGILVALGKHEPVMKYLGLSKSAGPAGATETIAVAPRPPGEYSIRDLLSDPDRPANVVFDQMVERGRTLRDNERKIQEEQARLASERVELASNEKDLSDKLSDIEAKIKELDEKQKAEQQRKVTQLMQRVEEISNAVQRMKPKGAADLLTEMWKVDPTADPDARTVVLDVFRSIPAAKRNKILDALTKSSKTDAADMVLEFIQKEPPITPTPAPG